MTLKLVFVEDRFFTRSDSGTVWGSVYFENDDGFAFPGRGWTDMAVPFASAWTEALVRLAGDSAVREIVWFMDGPYSLCLSPKPDRQLEVDFQHKEIVKHSATVRMEQLLENAIFVNEQLLTSCRQRGWPDLDRDTLALATATNQAVEARRRT